MACARALNLNLAVSSGDLAMDDAVYVPAPVDKIIGISGPYLHKCNATTGAREASMRITAPMLGPGRLTYYTGHATSMLYASLWFDPSWVDMNTNLDSPRMEIWAINPATFAPAVAVGIRTNISDLNLAYSRFGLNGPHPVISVGNYLYFAFRFQAGGGQYFMIDPTNPADNKTNSAKSDWSGYNVEGIAHDGTKFYYPEPLGGYMKRGPADLSTGSLDPSWQQVSLDTAPETPVSCAIANGFAYGVCGNGDLIKVLDWGTGNYISGEPTSAHYNAAFNLETIQANAKASRLKTNPYNGLLYIPIQNQDCVIVWNPATDAQYAGMLKTGFDGPVETVHTPTKSFAVQSGPVGLREIT